MHGDDPLPEGLAPDRLRRRIDPVTLGFETTETLDTLKELIGQDRALGAIRKRAELSTGQRPSPSNYPRR